MAKIELKRKELVLDPNNPFGDDLTRSRNELANSLTGLIKDVEEPLVIALDGEWGTGKTYFLERWASTCVSKVEDGNLNPCIINFSAWQDDDLEDPLLAVVGQIHHFLHAKKRKKLLNPDFNTICNELYQAANKILSKISQIASRLVDHYYGIDVVQSVKEFSNYQAQHVELYSETIQARADLKNRLINLANYVWESTRFPLVIIVDDLDRCRPPFAIALLERIKHLFNVPHVTFILGLDQKQFVNALHNFYGERFDAENYLQKLIDIEFQLPRQNLKGFIESLIAQHSIKDYLSEKGKADESAVVVNEFSSVLCYLSRRFNLSFRKIERLVREIVIIERIHPTSIPVDSTLIAILVCLRNHDRELFNAFVQDKISPKEMVDRLIRESDNSGNLADDVEIRIAIIVFACSKNSIFKDAISDLSLAIEDVKVRNSAVPNLFKNDKNAIGRIAEKACLISINRESVINVVSALNHFKDWTDDRW